VRGYRSRRFHVQSFGHVGVSRNTSRCYFWPANATRLCVFSACEKSRRSTRHRGAAFGNDDPRTFGIRPPENSVRFVTKGHARPALQRESHARCQRVAMRDFSFCTHFGTGESPSHKTKQGGCPRQQVAVPARLCGEVQANARGLRWQDGQAALESSATKHEHSPCFAVAVTATTAARVRG